MKIYNSSVSSKDDLITNLGLAISKLSVQVLHLKNIFKKIVNIFSKDCCMMGQKMTKTFCGYNLFSIAK